MTKPLTYREKIAMYLALYPSMDLASERFGPWVVMYDNESKNYSLRNIDDLSVTVEHSRERRHVMAALHAVNYLGFRPEKLPGFRTYPNGLYY